MHSPDRHESAGRNQTKLGKCNPTTKMTINAAAPAASCNRVACDRVAMAFIIFRVVMLASVFVAPLFSFSTDHVKNFLRTFANKTIEIPLTY